MKQHISLALAACLFLLSACGGGGGGGSSTTTTPPASSSSSSAPTDPNAIAGMQALNAYVMAMQTSNGSGNTGSAVSNAPVITASGVTLSSTTSCTSGGSLSTVLQLASLTGPTIGDTNNTTYNNCVLTGSTWTGTKNKTWTAVTDANNYSLGIAFTNLKSITSSLTTNTSGNINAAITSGASGETDTISSGNFTTFYIATGTSGNISVLTVNASTFIPSSSSANLTTNSLNMTATTTFGSTISNVSIAIVNPLVTMPDGSYVSGKIKITGTSTIAYITFLGSGNIQLDLDTNKDGSIDSSKTTTVSALQP